jgi:hypothetical protein
LLSHKLSYFVFCLQALYCFLQSTRLNFAIDPWAFTFGLNKHKINRITVIIIIIIIIGARGSVVVKPLCFVLLPLEGLRNIDVRRTAASEFH